MVIGVIASGSMSVAVVVSVIGEISVAIGTTTINHLITAITSIIALNHPSKHNIYCVHHSGKTPGKSVLVTANYI